jgi:transcription termination/antitermination protein NusG
MEKQWFVIHTLTGKESKVRDSLLRRIKAEEMGDLVGDVSIPSEKVSEVKKGKKSTTTRMFYPGYVLIQLCLFNDDGKINERAWYFVNDTPGVIGFLGGDRLTPMRAKEVESIVYQIEEKKEKVKPKVQFEPGETVKINDGPFLNFNGVIEEVDPERGKLKVSVSIFGRTAPVELEYWQVEHV